MFDRVEFRRMDPGLDYSGVSRPQSIHHLTRQELISSHLSTLFQRSEDKFIPRAGKSLPELVRDVIETPEFHGVESGVNQVTAQLCEVLEISLDEESEPLRDLSTEEFARLKAVLHDSQLPVRKPTLDPPARFWITDDPKLSETLMQSQVVVLDRAVAAQLGPQETTRMEGLALPGDVDPPLLHRFDHATLVGDFVALSMISGQAIADSDHLQLDHQPRLAARLAAGIGTDYHLTIKSGDYVSLAGSAAENFWHFIAENLPKLVVAENSGFQGKYIIPSDSRYPYAKEAMRLMGIPDARVEQFDGGCWEVEKLWVPSHLPLWESQQPNDAERSAHPWLLREVRERMLSSIAKMNELRDIQTPERLWVVRESTVRKHPMQNTEAARAVLVDEYGFVPVDMAKLSLAEQIHFVSHAKSLAGQHGAGMVHMLFLPEEATAVEFYSTGYVVDFDTPIRNANNIHYEPMVWAPAFFESADTDGGEASFRVDPSSVEVQVNTRALRSTLRRVFNEDSLPR